MHFEAGFHVEVLMDELEHIAVQVAEGRMTSTEGTNELLRVLYTNKGRFGLGRLDLDSLHEFLLQQYQKFKRLLCSYRSENEFSFSGFIYTSIQQSLRQWRRKNAQTAAVEESFRQQGELVYEEIEYRYQQEEFACCCEPVPEFRSGKLDRAAQLPEEEPQCKERLLHRDPQQAARTKTAPFRYNEKEDKLRKATYLILALKSSYYIDYDIIRKVSKVTGVSEKKIACMVEATNASMKRRISNHEDCLQSRDRAFFFHRRYRREYSKLEHGSWLARQTAQKYERQTEIWEFKNEQLKQAKYSAVPSNRTVARMLNLDDRKVASILQLARNGVQPQADALGEDS